MLLLLFYILTIFTIIDYLFTAFNRETITIKGVEIHTPYWYLEALEPKTKNIASKAGKTCATVLNYAQKLDLSGCVGYQLRLFRSRAETMTTMVIRTVLPIGEFSKSYNKTRIRRDYLAEAPEAPALVKQMIARSSKRKIEQTDDMTQATIFTNENQNELKTNTSSDTSDEEPTVPDIQTDPFTFSFHPKDE